MTTTIELPPLASYQRAAIFCDERNAVIEASTKAGKAQPLYSRVYTPEGFVRMGDVSPGDKVLAIDGTVANVVGVYPQGERDVYRLEFQDGAVVEADGEHLWVVRRNKCKPMVVSTLELASLSAGSLRRTWVPKIEPVAFASRPVPLDPYLVGVLIGDGCLHEDAGASLSSADHEILESVRSMLPRGHRLEHRGGADWKITAGSGAPNMRARGTHICSLLRGLGLMGCRSHQKFIPKCYRYNSLEVRWAMLQGILDTDGFVDKHGQPAIEQTSEALARDITELVESLGGSVLTSYRADNGYRDKAGAYVRCMPVWRQSIKIGDSRLCFRLRRKLEKCRNKRKTGHRMLRSVTFSRRAQCQCLEIDHPSRLYLTDHLIPTHNTFGNMIWLLEGALSTGAQGREYWWAAPIYEQTKIAYRRYKTLLSQMDPDKSIWSSNDTDPSITFRNGATIRFKSGDKPDGLYGEDVHRAVIDEASRCKPEAWYAIRSTLTATQGKVRIIGNVKGKKNWAYGLARRVESGEMPGWKYAKITCYDAVKEGIITQEEVEAARRELPEAVFRELYENVPTEDGSNPFGMEHIRACTVPLSTDPPVAFGVDLAKSSDFTVVLGLDKQRRTCSFERWQGESWERTGERILGIVGNRPTLVDSTGVGDPIVETLAKGRPNIEGFKFTNASKQQLMEGLALAIQRREVGFPEGVIVDELGNFEYVLSKTQRVTYSAPDGLHDDCVVALALAVERVRGHVPVTAGLVSMGAPPPPPPDERDFRVVIAEKRKDVNWGWEGGGKQERVSPAERYMR